MISERPVPGVEEELAGHGDGKIAVLLLDQQMVAVGVRVAQKRQPVGVAALALDLARQSQPEAGLADQVQGDVGECNILLQHRRVAAPFGQAVA